MQSYVAQLREFRGLQEELAPWTQAFSAKHGRKPCIADVEATGVCTVSLGLSLIPCISLLLGVGLLSAIHHTFGTSCDS